MSEGICRDIPTEEDSLGFKPYVEAIAKFLTADDTLPPITLSIEGRWGCGKSSFMRQLKREIDKKNEGKGKREYFTVWFNSWKHDKEEELWASFALNFMEELSKQLPWRHRQYSRLKLLWLRYKLKFNSKFLIFVYISWKIFSFILICSFLSLVITYVLHYLGMPLPKFIHEELINNFANFVLISAPLVGMIKYFSKETWFIDLFKDPFGLIKLESNTNYKGRVSFREHFHSDFNEIIKSYVGNSKVYVFIDDLDRCEVPKAAELMQALNLMISDNSKVYFSIGMDRKIISAGIAAKNKEVINCLGVNELEYGYEFIEKYIQLSFKVPSPKDEYFCNFIKLQHEKEYSLRVPVSSDNQLSKLLKNFEAFIYYNLLPTKTTIEDDLDISKSINSNYECEERLEEFRNIMKMVAHSLDGNPRRMKQFYNLFRFQSAIGSKNRLFSEGGNSISESTWNCRKLAKFVAISIQWPSLISALSLDLKLLDQLQSYALNPKNEYRKLEEWIKDERLISLLRYGCVDDDNNTLESKAEYTLSSLDFSKLLEISPEAYSSSLYDVVKDIKFVKILPGEFMMGSSEIETSRHTDEGPIHKVTVENLFYLSECPITQKQWTSIMGSNPSRFKGEDRPVERVSWNDVQEFIKKLNEKENTDMYRLPSEAEWEYACRAGTQTRYSFGDDESKLDEYAWYKNNSSSKTHPVGQKKPNPWGLYDIHGNVWEWVQDTEHKNYENAPYDGSVWEDRDSTCRVVRGCCWITSAHGCRSAHRRVFKPNSRHDCLGFRLVSEKQ